MTTASPSIPIQTAPTAAQTKRIIVAAAIGNGLIMYDFTVYSFSAVIIGKLYFPSSNPLSSLLMALATFGAGFLMRPLGAIVIGNLADHKGRKAGLLFSIVLMTLGTGIIAFTPSYASIGVTATVLIVLARLLQGLAAGGEIGAASAMLMELADKNQRCYMVSWRAGSQGASALAGALVGAVTTALLTREAMQDWGWRIPFILGMLVGPVGWYVRRHMSEAGMGAQHRPTVTSVFAQRSRTLWFGILLMAAPTASIYIMVFYMPTYLITTLHLSSTISLLTACLAGAVIFVGNPILARVADRQRRRKPIQYLTLIACIVLTYPAFLVLTHGAGVLLSLFIIGGYAAVALTNGGASAVMMLEAFPRHHRATGMSMIYSFGVTIFGGFSPFIVTWLMGVTGNPMAPAWYLLAALCISLFALIWFPETVEDR
ncbi:MFS transporter [Collimonas sp. OK412]|jgi:MFS family permease|uniref:MFS transporter n=1 Tax=Collimonas sp. (strain OK412) TaxID=1801619 RepID=UPI0008EA21A7|nr:MFS transporter [Collimonas sp. OK412]SFC85657.1 Predicted arabinose efflux permease, MFS family [Collimonas sp. OK412]